MKWVSPISVKRLPPEFEMWMGGFVLMSCLWLVMFKGQMDLLCALMVFGSLLLISLRDQTAAALLTIAFLNLLGDVRRIVAASFGQPTLDLLLLVGPGIALILAIQLVSRVRLRDPLSKAMLVLLVVMIGEIFNPQQGGLSVGISGILFYIAPVLWFWIGRELASPAVVERLLYNVLFPLALAAGVLGLCQNFIGFLPYEQAWINIASKTYVVLHVGNAIRAFGFSVSSSEYAELLAMGAAGTAAAFFGSRRYWMIAFPLLVTTVVLASSRGVLIRLIMSLTVVWAMRKGGRFRIRDFAYVGSLALVCLLAIGLMASRLTPPAAQASQKDSTTQSLLAHQTGGFAHPLDPRYSTAGIHSEMIFYGVKEGFTDPIGHGLGSTTLAATKFGGDPNTSSSEMDISDMFIGLGLLGGLVYVYIVFAAISRAFAYIQAVKLTVSLPVLAVLVSTLSTWLIGGQYSTSTVVCFLIGALAHEGKLVDSPIAAENISNSGRGLEGGELAQIGVPRPSPL
jgi:hypothetical protein